MALTDDPTRIAEQDGAPLSPPPLHLALTEAPRALGEASTLWWSRSLLLNSPKGDGHAVIFCPGFLYSDLSTAMLRRYVSRLGYDAYGWNHGRNYGLGTSGEPIKKVVDWASQIAERTGQPVTLVGWSLGGVVARETAKAIPDKVRQVITMGTMIRGGPESSNAHEIYKFIAEPAGRPPEVEALIQEFSPPPPDIPTTSIYSKADGIVPWRGCIEQDDSFTDNIEVVSSHLGLGFHAAVFHALADRLPLTRASWSPFDRNAPGWRRFVYPSSGHQPD